VSPLLLGRALWKRFGAVVAVADVEIEVRAREIHAVIGPNGAGKSTLLSLLAGELRPDAGRIFFEGRDVSRLPVHKRARLGLARTFQVSSVISSFTVLENVATAVQARSRSDLRILRTAAEDSELNEHAHRILDRLSLAHLAERPASALSHGERRLLELALALAQQPKVLLLDEPLAGVAPGESERLLDLLRSTRDTLGMLLVEHDMQAVFRIADRITVLVYGRCIASGSPRDIRSDPAVREAYLGDFLDIAGVRVASAASTRPLWYWRSGRPLAGSTRA